MNDNNDNKDKLQETPLKAVNDFYKYGYPPELGYSGLNEYYPVKGIIIAMTDRDMNVKQSYIGNRPDADKILDEILKTRMDDLRVIDTLVMDDGAFSPSKLVYIPYKNTLCTKYAETYTETCVNDLSKLSGQITELEIVVTANGYSRYVPVTVKTKLTSPIGILNEIINTVRGLIRLAAPEWDSAALSDYEAMLVDKFGITVGDDRTFNIILYNGVGEAISCSINDEDEFVGMIHSFRVLKLRNFDDDQ